MPGPNVPYENIFLQLRVFAPHSKRYWDQVDCIKVEHLKEVREKFCQVNTQVDPNFIQIFGTDQPDTDTFLLHRAPGWDKNPAAVPVLLVHGAGLDASSFTNLYNLGNIGLQQQLVSLGYRVFSVTFPHSHGNNYYQAEQLVAAIDRVKQFCQVPQVDLVAHSKGGIACRIYLSNLAVTPYQGDVRRFVMLGVPNLGIDFAFRNPAVSYLIFMAGGNGVIAWDKIAHLGTMIDVTDRSIYHDGAFPGQSQLLYRWDGVHPLDMTQQDWWTTYYGGNGFFSHSRGIEQAIEDGQRLIYQLEKQPVDSTVEISTLAGNNNLLGLMPLQSSIPGDGIVFVDSALNTDAMLAGGAKLYKKSVLPLNHIELLYSERAVRWVHKVLSH